MKKFTLFLAILSIIGNSFAVISFPNLQIGCKISFTTDGDIMPLVYNEIINTNRELLIQIYTLTDEQITDAIIAVARKGVWTRVVIDVTQPWNKTQVVRLLNGGVFVYYQDGIGKAHNKIVIIDREKVITGSANFTKAAQSNNSENLIVIKSQEIANVFAENFFSLGKNQIQITLQNVESVFKANCLPTT